MLHKIRQAMHDRDQRYVLNRIVELDEAYFGGPGEGGKRGRGTQKTPVLVSLSLNNKGNPLFAKMRVVKDVKGETIEAFVRQAVTDNAVLVSDGAKAYQQLGNEYKSLSMRFDPKQNPDHLQWLHTVVSNAKSFIAGTYHGLARKHLQRYLDEFCYRFNRRHFEGEWFHRLLTAAVSSQPISYAELTA